MKISEFNASYEDCLKYLQQDFEGIKALSQITRNPTINWLIQHILIYSWIIQIELNRGVVPSEEVIDLIGREKYGSDVNTTLKSTFMKLGFYKGYDISEDDFSVSKFALSQNMTNAINDFYGRSGDGPTYLLSEYLPNFTPKTTGGTFLALLNELNKNQIEQEIFHSMEAIFGGDVTITVVYEKYPNIRLVRHKKHEWSFLLGVATNRGLLGDFEVLQITDMFSTIEKRINQINIDKLIITTFVDDINIQDKHQDMPELRWMSSFSAIRFFNDIDNIISGCEDIAGEYFAQSLFLQNGNPTISVRRVMNSIKTIVSAKCDSFLEITSDVVKKGFNLLLERLDEKSQSRPGPKPTRFEDMYKLISAKNDMTSISMSELEAAFDTKNSRKAVANAVSDLNASFKENEIDLELKSETVENDSISETVYKFRRPSNI